MKLIQITLLLSLPFVAAFTDAQSHHIRLPDLRNGTRSEVTRGLEELKLSPELRALMKPVRLNGRVVSADAGRRSLQMDSKGRIHVRVTTGSSLPSPEALAGAKTQLLISDSSSFVAALKISDLLSLARLPEVTSIDLLRGSRLPIVPSKRSRSEETKGMITLGETDLAWDRGGLTGEGVIIADVDSGIDFRHEDFRNPDGTTRILYIWDMFDNSYARSHGSVGSAPPYSLNGEPLGTLYTEAQINQALSGNGQVNSVDRVGHGTACMSVAAGNKYGLAPGARIIMVNADSGGGGISYLSTYGAKWASSVASQLNMPIAMNMSYGTQMTAHDGLAAEEKVIDELVAAGKPGVALCVSAGNEGRSAAHAQIRFGPRDPSQYDVYSEPVAAYCSDASGNLINAYLNAQDDWGLAFQSANTSFVDESGKRIDMSLFIFKVGGTVRHLITRGDGVSVSEALTQAYSKAFSVEQADGGQDVLSVALPAGNYWISGFGASSNVVAGTGDLYAPRLSDVAFGEGGSKMAMVSSPGNAANAITVGSYIARNTWSSAKGGQTNVNLELGSISDFSNVGPRRDGLVKPDIVAPGQYMLSARAKDSEMGNSGDWFTSPDGKYLAWQGTSASSPFTAGVIALMFQKNPKLDIEQIRDILRRTATQDQLTGRVPNPTWGYGKLNVQKALTETPTP